MLLTSVALLLLVLAAGSPKPTIADNPQSQVDLRVSPAVPWVMPGEMVTFAIHAQGNVGVSGAEVALSLGPDLELLEVKPGPFLGGDTITAPPLQDSEGNQATYAWARIGPTPSPTSPGALALVTLRASEGRPWNTWVRARVRLVDADFQAFQETTESFDVHVYQQVPSPIPVFPDAGSRSGPHTAFGLKTLAPGPLQYRIEVSRDDFQTVLHTFDQTISPQGWDREERPGSQLARFQPPMSLDPGDYQWRAYAWVPALGEWSHPGRVAQFQVSGLAQGLSSAPLAMVGLSNNSDDAVLTLEGWGFTDNARVYLSSAGGAELPAEVRHWDQSRITVALPRGVDPGLARARVEWAEGSHDTVPVLLLPPGWFTVRMALPEAGGVAVGKEFSVPVWVTNRGADAHSMAVLEVRLPDPEHFPLVEVGAGPGAKLLEQLDDRVLLSATAGAVVDFQFRLSPGAAAPGDFLDLALQPRVLGAVSATRWGELEPRSVSQVVEAVQRETAEVLRVMARSLDQVPSAGLESLPTAGPEAELLADLRLQLEEHGLAADGVFGPWPGLSLTTQEALPGREHPGDIAGGIYSSCCGSSPLRLQVLDTVAPSGGPKGLLSHPPGFGERSYISPDRPLSFRVSFPTPGDEDAEVRVMAQLDSAMELESLRMLGSSHPEAGPARVHQSNNTVTWDFQGGARPSEPEEEGWVEFTVRLRDGLPSGTNLVVRAASRLDSGAPVETNQVRYTIDAAAPATRAGPLAPVQLDPSFRVPWEGSDNPEGSGIAEVVLLVSRDGGPYEVLGSTSGSGVPFQGRPGSTYGFAAAGIDRVGNVQALPWQPDAVVAVGHRVSYQPGTHLVGVPILESAHPWNFLDGPKGTWRAWDPVRREYLPAGEVLPDAPPEVSASRGWWVKLDEPVKGLVWGKAAPSRQPFSIDLQTGWNLVASPFAAPVPWSLEDIRVRSDGAEKTLREAQAAGWMEDFAWGWDGEAYDLVYQAGGLPGVASTLEPFQGYWMQAHRPATLVLPPPP